MTTTRLAEMKALLPVPSILSTESAREFEEVCDKLLACMQVRDALEVILIRDFAEASWEIHRYTRLRTISFARSFRQSLDYQAQRVKAQRTRRQERVATLAEHATLKPDDIAQAMRLENDVVSVDTEVDAILARTPSELDHAHALEKNLSFHTGVESLIASISKRRNEALQLLEMYRAGLGKRVDEAMSEIIDADHNVVEEPVLLPGSPSVVPSLEAPIGTETAEESE